jgi:plasmid stabilization system protein ParE
MAPAAKVAFHPEAIAEFDAAVDWYARRSEQAADDFVRAVNDAVSAIEIRPLMWAEYLYGTRRYVLRHFPFVVVYLLNESRITIVAIAHGRRRPGYWKERITAR